VHTSRGDFADQIPDRAEATQAITGADADKLLAIASSVSSAGITDPKEIVDIAQTALRSQGGDAGRGAAVAGAAIDLSNTLQISVKEAFGVLFQTAGAARPEDIALLGKAAVRATSALTGAGVGAEKAQELFAATTLLTGDKTGEQAVSVANDLTAAFRKIQQEGIPETIKVAGEAVDVEIPEVYQAMLTGDALKDLTLSDLLDLSTLEPEIAKVVTAALPNSQNRSFTEQIVSADKGFVDKIVQARGAIDLKSAGARTDQQVADVEGRRVVSVLGEQIDAILDRNKQDQAAAFDSLARDAFSAVLDRTDAVGPDKLIDALSRTNAVALEASGDSPAIAGARELLFLTQRNKLQGKDAETATATIEVLKRIDELAEKSRAGDLSSREANATLGELRAVMQGMYENNQQQVALLQKIAGDNDKPKVQQVKNVDAGPVEAPPAAAGVP